MQAHKSFNNLIQIITNKKKTTLTSVIAWRIKIIGLNTLLFWILQIKIEVKLPNPRCT